MKLYYLCFKTDAVTLIGLLTSIIKGPLGGNIYFGNSKKKPPNLIFPVNKITPKLFNHANFSLKIYCAEKFEKKLKQKETSRFLVFLLLGERNACKTKAQNKEKNFSKN